MTRGRVAALWVLTVAVFTAAQIANGVSGTTAYFTDSHAGSISFSLAVPPPASDTTGPAFTAPADQTVEATEAAGAVASWIDPTSTDAVDGAVPVTCAPGSGSTFPLGTTTVTCTSTDAALNTTTHAFTVTVVDTTAPVVAAHGPRTVEATSHQGADVTYTAPATSDAVDGAGVATCAPASGRLFPLGHTPVLCDAVDAAGNHAATTQFIVTVRDTTPPAFAVPDDQAIPATGPSGAVATWASPTATDAVDGTDPAHCLPASGSTFPIGKTTVTCTATDEAGNTNSHAFTVTVRAIVDTTAPVIEQHGSVIAEATSATGANVAYTSPATSDAVDGVGVATCAPASGSPFQLGTTTVLCDAVDAAGNHAEQTGFTVTVADTTGPAFTAPGDQSILATGPGGAIATWATPTATDAVDGADPVACLPASGSTFPEGATAVTCASTDTAGNTTSHAFTITVVAPTVPVAVPTQAPAPNARGWTSANTEVTWHWSDAGSEIDTARCTSSTMSSGQGTLTLTATCTNKAGRTGSASYTVKVDKTKPAVAITGHPTSSSASSAAAFTFTATDAISGIDAVTCKLDAGPAAPCTSPVSYAGLTNGPHTFTVTATDLAGNSSEARFTWCATTHGPSISVGHTADGSNGWNRLSPVAIAITVTAGTDPLTAPPTCTKDGNDLAITGSASPYTALIAGDGLHDIRCTVTDTADRTASSTDTLRIDTARPTVTVPADIVVDATVPGGVAVTYGATFADATSGLATGGCEPASGSAFAIGTTTVTCTAADKAGNRQSATFTVLVTDRPTEDTSANEAKQAVLASLAADLAAVRNHASRHDLADAIGHLRGSLDPDLWITSGPHADGNHLDPSTGSRVFDEEQAAVSALMGIRDPAGVFKAAIAALAEVDRLLAQTAIDDAIAEGADPDRVSAAQEEMTSAQGDLVRRRFDLAIDHWRRAWREVTSPPDC